MAFAVPAEGARANADRGLIRRDGPVGRAELPMPDPADDAASASRSQGDVADAQAFDRDLDGTSVAHQSDPGTCGEADRRSGKLDRLDVCQAIGCAGQLVHGEGRTVRASRDREVAGSAGKVDRIGSGTAVDRVAVPVREERIVSAAADGLVDPRVEGDADVVDQGSVLARAAECSWGQMIVLFVLNPETSSVLPIPRL